MSIQVQADYTDTFSGGLNYSWVKQVVFEVPDDASRQLITRRVKAKLGLTGVPFRTEYHFDDEWQLKEEGAARAIVISLHYDEDDDFLFVR